jgi:hypothetical protein
MSEIDLGRVPAEEVESAASWAAQRQREQRQQQGALVEEDEDMDAEGEPAIEEGEKQD